jgi:pimeloyl-ACP methyl ester carboxylesterase
VRVRFDGYTLDTDTLELRKGGAQIVVEPQVFEVLAYLVDHRDRVVTKDELLDEVWGNRFVSESALTTRIKQARHAVGDDGRRQAVIKTLHGKGYRFVARVQDSGSESPSISVVAPFAPTSRIPQTRWAESDGASIAYQTFGDGPDLVLIAGFTTNVEVQWEHPAIASFLRRLGTFSRVTVLDKRGVGLSDRMPRDDPPPLETRADDLRAVMDAAGIDTATVLGSSEGGSLAVMFTASHPDRVERLILHGTWVRHPTFPTRPAEDLDILDQRWGTGGIYQVLAPGLATDEAGRQFLARYERQSATPRAARCLRELSSRIDVGTVLGAIRVPTLVLHRRDDDRIPYRNGQQLAASISDARLVTLDGSDHYLFAGDAEPLLDAIEEFVTGESPRAPVDRVLATVLFVDIVDSTVTAQRLGDRVWSDLLEDFQEAAARIVVAHRGELVKTTGDGLVATFDGPGRGVRAAGALRDAAASLGLALRAGLHTAEIQRVGDDIAGIGVHLASRVAEQAGPDEVWVSRTVTDLVAGTGLTFQARGVHLLQGFDQPWDLYAADV